MCKFTKAHLHDEIGSGLKQYLGEGYHGTMHWMEETVERRVSPEKMWPEAKTAIVLALNYGPAHDPLDILSQSQKAAISVYAQNRDYHDIIKGRLKQIAQKIASRNQFEVKVFVDTAPLMEKPLAHQAGIGWQGKHTNLVSREHGSWLFLGTILTDQEFDADQSEEDHCGSCQSCLDICPTNAFPAPYKIDARRCISYLTIEHAGPIPVEFRKPMGNRIYGCDDCLAVCPWNKFAVTASETKLAAREELISPSLEHLASLDDEAFRAMFSGSPVKRIGRNRFIRNVLIAIGNSSATSLVKSATSLLDDPDPIVRGAAIWAFGELVEEKDFLKEKELRFDLEKNPDVAKEWGNSSTL